MGHTPRSRRLRRTIVRTPGGRLAIHYKKRKYDVPKCAICKHPLNGFPKLRPKDVRKGHRPPTRIFGGYLCANCLEKFIREKVMSQYSTSGA
ncbi:MAG: 50S ribosomal protein L34e [Thermoprotei archaeon]|nr:MAG: 50S ribosomal protein L34e [Thermoprotei archaeon]RLE82656.1 MAG: 50S ribosomal protein L34e [Thermoprotei archaeon]RLF03591.1 MAG: 50S ribosomal protein L34e [Thermoprotei archaeon]